MQLSSGAFIAVVLTIVALFGAVTPYTFRRIQRFPMPDVQKNAWRLVVDLVPVFGLIS